MNDAIILTAILACAACGGSRARDATFPQQAVLDDLPTVVPQALPDAIKASHVVKWAVGAPAPALYGPGDADPDNPAAAILAAHAKACKGNVKPAAGLDCYAREAARALGDGGQVPQEELEVFVATRCGLAGFSVATSWVTWQTGAHKESAAFQKDALAAITNSLAATKHVDPVWLGVAVYQGEKAEVALVATGRRRIAVVGAPTRVEGPSLQFSVEAGKPLHRYTATVTSGTHDSQACHTDPTPAGARVTCPMRSGDRAARIEVSEAAPGRILATTVATLDVGIGVALSTLFEASGGGSALGAEEGGVRAVLLAVNDLRATAGRPPMQLDPDQQAVASRVAPHLFDAFARNDVKSDTLAMAMIAGWRIGVPVTRGTFVTLALHKGATSGQFAARIAASPSGRRALLGPTAGRLAVSSQVDADGDLGLVLFAYDTPPLDAVAAQVEPVWSMINAARSAAKVRALERPSDLADSCADAAKALRGKVVSMDEALEAVKDVAGASEVPRQLYAFGYRGFDVEQVPKELLARAYSAACVATVMTRAEGAAWVQPTAVMVLE